MRKVCVRVPATMGNLGSGFDVLGAALYWHNFVTLTAPCDDINVTVTGEGKDAIPLNEQNIAVQIIQRLLRVLPGEAEALFRPGFSLHLDNRFPLTRGLGSSAAVRVGTLVAANTLLGLPLTKGQILSLAAETEGHADNVTAALYGGITVAVPSGEGVIVKRIIPAASVRIALLIPDFPLETGKARSVLPDCVSLSDAVFNLGRMALLLSALMTGDFSLLREAMDDRLHQPYRKALMPWLPEIFRVALDAGAMGVHLSGSGPTVAAWCEGEGEAIVVAETMWQALNDAGLSGSYRVVRLDWEGVKVVTEEG